MLVAGTGEPARRAVCGIPADTGALQLVLNIPAYRLEVIEQGTVTATLTVAVGSARYRTPIGDYGIDYVEWNPWWRPPDSPWARKERPARPGWSNPVGRVKLHVMDLVFVHGSPLVQSLGSAASHACVRLSNADALTLARLVHHYASPSVPSMLLDSLEADTTATRKIMLTSTVPISIRYELVEVRGEELVIHPDIYRLAGSRIPTTRASAMAALSLLGRDTVRVRRNVLRAVLRAGRARQAFVNLDSLTAAPAATP